MGNKRLSEVMCKGTHAAIYEGVLNLVDFQFFVPKKFNLAQNSSIAFLLDVGVSIPSASFFGPRRTENYKPFFTMNQWRYRDSIVTKLVEN